MITGSSETFFIRSVADFVELPIVAGVAVGTGNDQNALIADLLLVRVLFFERPITEFINEVVPAVWRWGEVVSDNFDSVALCRRTVTKSKSSHDQYQKLESSEI